MPPLLSFVLVGDDGRADLEAAAASLLGPELADLEVLVVGDAPGLAVLVARDPRVRVLPRPSGDVSAARDLALDAARGEWIWCLEPGERPAPGTIAGVAERLRASQPDVLLAGRGAHRRLLDRVARDGVTTLERRPGLADAAPGLADKVLRRELLRRLEVRFSAGAHGELPVTWPALLAAERIAAVPLPRGEAPEGRPPAAGPPEAAFAGDDALFAHLARHPELPAEGTRLVLPAMLRRGLATLDRLPAADRRAYFEALAATWHRHRRGDERLPGGRAARIEVQLLERGDFRAFTLARGPLRARRRLRRDRARLERQARRVRRGLRRRRLERDYRARRRQPVDPDLAVFAAYWYRGYACNPRAIYEKARELVPEMRGVWVVKPEAADSLPAGVEHVVPNTPEYFDVLARARFFVNNVNFPNHLVKREGTVHVMTHHGTPLKHMGMDLQATPITGARMDFEALLRRCARWDYSVSSNHFSTEVWERVYPTRYESLEVGYPRNDVLVDPDPEIARRVRAELGIEPGQVAVLYAPTHREYRSSYVPVLDLAAVAEGLGPDHVVLARAHYFYEADRQLRELHRQGRVRDVADHPSVEALCLAADVLVTDYSSIMFDYAVLDRPIVIHAPDWEVYRALRGTYFDLLAEPPGLVTRTEAEVVAGFASGAVSGEAATRARAEFRARFCSLEDGHAAERVVRRVWLGDAGAARRNPAAAAR